VYRYRIPALLLLFLSNVIYCPRLPAQSPSAAPVATTAPDSERLTIKGDVEKPLSLSLEDLHHLPRKTLKVTNPHDKKEETYEGVLVSELFKRAGVPQNGQLRGAAMASYVQADAADGYRVIFSLAELDTDFQDSDVIVADTMNGAPLDDQAGPFRLIAPHDKRPARWIRMLQSLTVVQIPK
jgi:DMSO/TMAO reductase YedYZ molybdopterin-dependent catalytic subunit